MTALRTPDEISACLQSAFASKNLDLLGQLLADHARWGDDSNPNHCRSRDDVVGMFRRLLDQGVTGEVTERHVGSGGVALRLHVEWPNPGSGRTADFWHSYIVAGGEIVEIEPHHGRRSAIRAISN